MLRLVTFVLGGVIQKIMAVSVFNPIFPCKFMKSLMKLKPLKFITESPALDVGQTTAKVSAVMKAAEAYRSKDVLKLKQIHGKYKLVEPGYKVLDIGAAPGSWSQFLAEKTNANGKGKGEPVGLVVAIDLKDFDKIEGVHTLPKMDFLKESSQNKIAEILGRGKKFDFIFSDFSPIPSGVQHIDSERMVKSIFWVYIFMMKYLKRGGGCLLKVQGAQDDGSVRREAKKLFKTVHYLLPPVAPRGLPDAYLMGRDFLGGKM